MTIARCLIVDDDSTYREILEHVAAPFGLETTAVSTAAGAIEALQRRDYAVIFLDLHLAGSDVSAVVDYIRRVKPHVLSRVIAVTSHPSHAIALAPEVPVVDKGSIETLRQRVASLL